MNNLIDTGKQYLQNTYNKIPVVFEKGEGCYLIDDQGNKYLDFVGGIAVNALGYKNEGLQKVLKDIIEKGLLHCSNLYWNKQEINVAEKLTKLSELKKAFFCNSGAEANEAALKLARKFGATNNKGSKIISMEHSFHGRTYGAITATGQKKYHKNFYPLLSDIVYAQFNDLKSVETLCDDKTCAIIVEPLQGEGGIIPATQEFLSGLRKICDEQNILLIFDEVQCGMGRSAKPFCFQHFGVKPDVLTLAKALALGIPCGAMVAGEKAENIFEPGDHASTFGGNLTAMAASSYMLDTLKDESFLNQVKENSDYLVDKLNYLKTKYPSIIAEVRGIGFMQGLQLKIDPKQIIQEAYKNKILVLSAGKDVLRFVPPLIISKKEIDKGINCIDDIIQNLV